jgi:hypothetical protein
LRGRDRVRQQRQPDLCGGLVGLAAGIRRHAFERRVVIFPGAGGVALRFVGEGALNVSADQHAARRRHDIHRRFGLGEPDRLAGIGDGAVDIALGAPDHRAIVVGRGERRIEPDRFVDIRQRTVEVAQCLFGGAAILIGVRVLRADLDRLIVVGKRFCMVALAEPGIAAVVINDAARRADPQRVVEIRDRDVVFALVEIGRTAKVVERDPVAAQPQRLGGIGDHLRIISLLVPADRAPEIHRRQFRAGECLQRDDLVAGVDLLVGRRALAGAERAELAALLGGCRRNKERRPRGCDHRAQQDRTAHESPRCDTLR